MTGSEFYSYALQVLKRTDKSAEIYTAIADTVMDMRAKMLSDEHSEIATTPSSTLSIGDYKLAVPSDLGHIIGDVMIRDDAADEGYYPLIKISKAEYDILYHDNLNDAVGNRNTGTPIHWCFYGGEIYLGPAVDKTTYEFTINYTTEDTPTYTAASTSIPFTDQFREVVRAGVLFRMFRELEQYDASDRWKAVYDEGIDTIITNDEQKTEGSASGLDYHGI